MAQDKTIKATYHTPAFRLSYPSLFEATPDMNGNLKFSITMLFPKKNMVAQMKKANHPAAKYCAEDNCAGFWLEINKVLRANFGPEAKPADFKITAFRDGDQPKKNGKIDENAKGFIWTKATSNVKNPPKCLRQDKTEIGKIDEGELYAGCWARAILTIAPFVKGDRGITYYLAGVQKLADDQAFSGRPRVEDEFDQVAESVVSPVASAPAAAPVNPWEA